MKLDLHIHSTASDGSCTPTEVVDRAIAVGLDVIALADHDTVAGVDEAVRAARGRRLDVIPAAELSSTYRGEDVHVLGYFLDVNAPALESHAQRGRDRRAARMDRMIERLQRQGVHVTRNDVQARIASKDAAPARPHLAQALVAKGHAPSVAAAFQRLIGNDCPAYVPTEVATPEEVVEVAVAAGGIAVWAHPPGRLLRELLPRLVDAGLRGLEVFRPPGRSASVEVLNEAARRHGLLVTGGSDWHGPERGSELGAFTVAGHEVAAFLAAGGMQADAGEPADPPC